MIVYAEVSSGTIIALLWSHLFKEHFQALFLFTVKLFHRIETHTPLYNIIASDFISSFNGYMMISYNIFSLFSSLMKIFKYIRWPFNIFLSSKF